MKTYLIEYNNWDIAGIEEGKLDDFFQKNSRFYSIRDRDSQGRYCKPYWHCDTDPDKVLCNVGDELGRVIDGNGVLIDCIRADELISDGDSYLDFAIEKLFGIDFEEAMELIELNIMNCCQWYEFDKAVEALFKRFKCNHDQVEKLLCFAKENDLEDNVEGMVLSILCDNDKELFEDDFGDLF